jgi:hypothetical protein
MRRLGYVVLSVCLLAGCGDTTLAGSVSALFPLDVSAEVVQVNGEAFQVTYLHNRATAVDIVAQIGLATSGLAFQPGASIDLSGDYTPGHPRCTVTHHADGEPERTLPLVSKGSLHLGSGGQVGQQTSGDFSIAFVIDGSYGSGRTIYGSFGGVAVDAGF